MNQENELQKSIEALSGVDEARVFQQKLRDSIPELMGEFPLRKSLVPPSKVTGKIERPDCIIEKVIFESQPKFYVTANLYLPRNKKVGCPAVLFICGHYRTGKSVEYYHATGNALAHKGYVVLICDPVGQGERSQYIQEKNIWRVYPCVSQHNTILRPSFLLGRTLLHFRIWDGIRALDYLLSRSEVDPSRVGVVGNSGGGEMALIFAGVEERVRVCVSCSHGGCCENFFLTGVFTPRHQMYSLIPPRPLLLLWGSGEMGNVSPENFIPSYLRSLYTKLGADPLVYTKGVRATGSEDYSSHSLERAHREQICAWMNHWLDNEAAGSTEGAMKIEDEKNLLCTKRGQVLLDFPNSESTFTLNKAYLQKIAVCRKIPRTLKQAENELELIRKSVKQTFGIEESIPGTVPEGGVKEELYQDNCHVEKVVLNMGDNVTLWAKLYTPIKKTHPELIIFASEFSNYVSGNISCELVKSGFAVFMLDVRFLERPFIDFIAERPKFQEYDYNQEIFDYDRKLIEASVKGKPILGQQVGDILCSLNWLKTRAEFAESQVVVMGEGIGGLWAMIAAAFDSRVSAAIAYKTLLSFRSLVEEQFYAYSKLHSYFCFPSIVRKLDIADIASIIAPKPCLLLDPITALAKTATTLTPEQDWKRVKEVYRLLKAPKGFSFKRSKNQSLGRILENFLG
jgi:cephalosporin-C deacetylase-like acetyl esterase